MFLLGLAVALPIAHAFQSIPSSRGTQGESVSRLYYNYFKKDGEKKEIGRLWKNIIFPGIYQEYQDTKEPKKTIKIKVESPKRKSSSRNGDESFFSDSSKSGTYNMVDPSTAPKVVSSQSAKQVQLKQVTRPVDFVAPTPQKKITLGGLKVLPNLKARPTKPIILYEDEASPDCKKVREACSLLDLTVEIRPCPGSTSGFADQMSTVSLGQRSVPFMIDTNPIYRPQLSGSTEIIEHLFNTYGPGAANIPGSLKGGLNLFKNSRSSVRKNARPDNTKMRPITLYGWEGANFVRQVRVALTELGIAHVMINCAEGSVNRAKLSAKTGTFQVPYIVDPNTGVEMFESAEIVKYLEKTYTI